jgi:hypothetical protein
VSKILFTNAVIVPCEHDIYCCSEKCTAVLVYKKASCEQSQHAVAISVYIILAERATRLTIVSSSSIQHLRHNLDANHFIAVCSVAQYCCPTGIYDQASCQDCPIAEGQETGTCTDDEPYAC